MSSYDFLKQQKWKFKLLAKWKQQREFMEINELNN